MQSPLRYVVPPPSRASLGGAESVPLMGHLARALSDIWEMPHRQGAALHPRGLTNPAKAPAPTHSLTPGCAAARSHRKHHFLEKQKMRLNAV